MGTFLHRIETKLIRLLNDGLPPDQQGMLSKFLTPLDPLINSVNTTVGECGFHDLRPRLCYPKCPPGQHGALFESSPVCTADCPPGTTDLIIGCSYGIPTASPKLKVKMRSPRGCDIGCSLRIAGKCVFPGACTCHGDEEQQALLCYSHCEAGYNSQPFGACSRDACDPGTYERVGLCYEYCKPGFNPMPGFELTNCSMGKDYSARIPYIRWTTECDAGDTDEGQAPGGFGMCWYGTGYFRVTNISGFSKMRITKSSFVLDCASTPRMMRLTCTADCPIRINFEWGFKICTGLPFAQCDSAAYPTYNYHHEVNHALDLEFEIDLPFEVDFKDVNVDLSGVQLRVSKIGIMDGVVAEAVSMVKPSIDTAATVIRNINIFEIKAIRDFQDKVDLLYQQFLPLVANGGQKISEEIVKTLNDVLKDPLGNDKSFVWPFPNAGDVCNTASAPTGYACGGGTPAVCAPNSFGLFEGTCGQLKYKHSMTLYPAGQSTAYKTVSLSASPNVKFGPRIGTHYLRTGQADPASFVFLPTKSGVNQYYMALGLSPKFLVTRAVTKDCPAVGSYCIQINDSSAQSADLATAIFTLECGEAPGSIRIKVVDPNFPDLYLVTIPGLKSVMYSGGSTKTFNSAPIVFDFYTNDTYPPVTDVPAGANTVLAVGVVGFGLGVVSNELVWGVGLTSGLYLEQTPINDRWVYMRFNEGVVQAPAAEDDVLRVMKESESSIMSFEEEYKNALIVEIHKAELGYNIVVASPRNFAGMLVYAYPPAVTLRRIERQLDQARNRNNFGITRNPQGVITAFFITDNSALRCPFGQIPYGTNQCAIPSPSPVVPVNFNPLTCPPDTVLSGALCYPPCPAGFTKTTDNVSCVRPI